MNDEKRFWSHVRIEDGTKGECWVWIGATTDEGRGRFYQAGSIRKAHRVAYKIRTGEEIPPRHRLEQTCQTVGCVRHWRIGRQFVKLTRQDVRDIERSTLNASALAKRYQVSKMQIYRVKSRFALMLQRRISSGRAYA